MPTSSLWAVRARRKLPLPVRVCVQVQGFPAQKGQSPHGLSHGRSRTFATTLRTAPGSRAVLSGTCGFL